MDLRHLDLDAISARYEACFARENHDRPLLWLCAPNGQPAPAAPPLPDDIRARWFDFEGHVERFAAHQEATAYLAEGVPSFFCNLGPDVLTAFMGSEIEFAADTSWVHPRVSDWAEEPPLRFNPASPYWQAMERFVRLSLERGAGRWLTQSGDLHGNADALSALRGPEQLCMDLLINGDEVQRRLDEVFVAWREAVDRHLELILPACGGFSSGWIPVAARGRFAVTQNDFSCMVSPETFRAYFLEPQRAECRHLDRTIYHWDGPGAIPHLDALCEIDEIHSIQWVPGAGAPPMREWVPLLQDIQRRGKGLTIYCPLEDVLEINGQLAPEGVMFFCTAPSIADAEAVIRGTEQQCTARRPTLVQR